MSAARQLKRCAEKVKEQGYAQVRVRLSPSLLYMISVSRRPGESTGMVLERLVCGTPLPLDPKAAARAAERAARREANQRAFHERRLATALNRRQSPPEGDTR